MPEGGKMKRFFAWLDSLFPDTQTQPTVTLQAVNAIAAANGTSFADMLAKAEESGLLSQQGAAALRTKAKEDLAGAKADLEREITAAQNKYDARSAKADEVLLQAKQKDASANETLEAVAAFKRAMGK